MAKNIFRILDQGWTFKQEAEASDKWRPVSQFPTNVHLDLLANHEIPDPSIGKNELGVQWVGEKAWQYRTTFQSPIIPEQSGLKAVLEFHGLDTYADVVLNGTPILKTENMFIPERVDVTSLIQSQDNHLLITFSSAFLKGKKLAEKYRNHYWGCWNGDPSRLAVRKAQYHYGWDWGPTLLTCGPWRPVHFHIYESCIRDVHVLARVDESLESASVRVTVDTEGLARTVTIELILERRVLASNIVTAKANSAECLFELHRETNTKDLPLKLWFPSGYGQQPLYTVTVTLSSKDGPVQSANKRFGLRRANVVQQSLADAPGKSFMFVVNDVPMFCGGSNWIPADNFIPRVSEQRYRDWIKLVVQSNQVMLRVWGGGIFEQPAFYDACDEMGILVWQDFMFACGNYPAHPEFLETVKREATANVQALRHHPSIVIWAGNNEDYQYCESEGLNYDPDDKNPEHWLKSSFPARYIYEDILPRVMKSLAPDTYYHFGSPWGGKNTRDPTVGDIHQWNVWHGSQERYQDYDKLGGRFVSEFGMEALPCIDTIKSFVSPDSPEFDSQSSTMDFHNKAAGHERRLATYLVENLRFQFEPLEKYVYYTQLVQAECLGSAYRSWRRQWKGPGREYCAGTLAWQMNDCWPGASWSIADYYLRPKLAFYVVKRELAPLSISMKRVVHEIPADRYTRVYIKTVHKIELWASNFALEDKKVNVVVKAWSIDSGEARFCRVIRDNFCLPANRSTEISEFDVPVREQGVEEGNTVVAAYLTTDRGDQIARCTNWPEPLKFTPLKQPKDFRVETSPDGTSIRLSAEVPVKGTSIEAHVDGVSFSDNCVDLVPDETTIIGIKGLDADDRSMISVRYLGM